MGMDCGSGVLVMVVKRTTDGGAAAGDDLGGLWILWY